MWRDDSARRTQSGDDAAISHSSGDGKGMREPIKMTGIKIAQAAMSEAKGAGYINWRAQALANIRRAQDCYNRARGDIDQAYAAAIEYLETEIGTVQPRAQSEGSPYAI